MKKMVVGLIAVALIIGLSSIVIFSASEKWEGKSADNKWKVTYKPDGTSHDTWAGTLNWKGKGEAVLQNIQLIINGESALGYDEDENMNQKIKEKWTFGNFSAKPNEDDKIYVALRWEEGDQTFTENIVLTP